MPDDHVLPVLHTLLLPVLHTLRLVGFADTDVVVLRTGLDVDVVVVVLREAADRGWVTHRSGRLTGWSLTTEGRTHGESLLAAELGALGRRDAVVAAYSSFREVNQRFLDLCTDWQLRPGPEGELVVNDHDDLDHDAAVRARLGDLDERVRPVLSDLGRAVARFAPYPTRLRHARDRVERGELDWFTRPVIDSYHTVWFELHEDLLATLGLDRSSEH